MSRLQERRLARGVPASTRQILAAFQADGDRNAEALAYERVGRIVLEQSDFLIAVWDGEPAAGRGGTTQIVQEALEQNVPVIWLHADRPRPPCVLLIDDSDNRQELQMEELESRFASRFSQAGGDTGSDFNFSHAYCAEKQPWFDFGRLFRIFRDVLAKGKFPGGSWKIKDFEPSARAEWTRMISQPPAPPEATQRYLLDRLCPHYAWADGLSGYYAGLLRSSSLATNLLSASAVLVAMLGLLFHGYHMGRPQNPGVDRIHFDRGDPGNHLAWPPQALARTLAQLQAARRVAPPILLPGSFGLPASHPSAARALFFRLRSFLG
ncbi:MAG: hypothetical protein WDM87_15470 [Terracidiphilus sp.]